MYTGHVDSEVEVAVGLVVAVRTWNVENLVMNSLHMSLHVLLAGKGLVTPASTPTQTQKYMMTEPKKSNTKKQKFLIYMDNR